MQNKSVEDWENEIEVLDENYSSKYPIKRPQTPQDTKKDSGQDSMEDIEEGPSGSNEVQPRDYLMTGVHLGVVAVLLFLGGKYQLYQVSVIGVGVYLMMINFSTRKREAGELSAYSIFNKNFERAIGTFDSSSLGGFGRQDNTTNKKSRKRRRVSQDDLDSDDSETEEDRRILYWLKKGRFSNKKCYCGSPNKYKKCCLPSDRLYFNGRVRKELDDLKDEL